ARATNAYTVEAAKAATPLIGRQCLFVLKVLSEFGAASDTSLQRMTGISGDTERPRRVKLVRLGLVRQVGEATTPTGRRCAVWGITNAGSKRSIGLSRDRGR